MNGFEDVQGADRAWRALPGGRKHPAYIVPMQHDTHLQALTDDELLHRIDDLLGRSRVAEADLVAHIGEVDVRRLFAREASPSTFAWCTERLHFSESEAYLRIAAARAARSFPVLLDMLRDGRMHLSGIERLAPHLTRDNCDDLLARAARKSKRRIEELVADLRPRPDAPASIRKLPERRPPAPPVNGVRPDGVAPEEKPQLRPDGVEPPPVPPRPEPEPPRQKPVEPLGAGRYKIQFTVAKEQRDRIERLCALMRRSMPGADLGAILDAAVSEKLERLEARRFAKTSRPRKTVAQADTRPRTRNVPAPIRRLVFERDDSRCQYVDEKGRQCTERHDLEYHHRLPFGFGGGHDPGEMMLACPTHNALIAEVDYGKAFMERHRRSSGPPPGALRNA